MIKIKTKKSIYLTQQVFIFHHSALIRKKTQTKLITDQTLYSEIPAHNCAWLWTYTDWLKTSSLNCKQEKNYSYNEVDLYFYRESKMLRKIF